MKKFKLKSVNYFVINVMVKFVNNVTKDFIQKIIIVIQKKLKNKMTNKIN